MPRSYAPQFRAMVIDQVRGGRPVAEVAASVGVNEATVFRWVRQDRIDRGELPGTSTGDNAELRAAKRRITELEAELATVKRASELFAKREVVRPKDLFGLVVTLAAEGHGTKRTCRILTVAPSGFFRWRSQPMSARAVRRAWLADVITEIHIMSRRTYGWRRVRAELAEGYGQIVNKKLVRAVMIELGLSGLPKHRKAKKTPNHPATSVDLVNRDFFRDGPNQLWMTDITEHPSQGRQAVLLCRPRCLVPEGGRLVDRPPTDGGDGQRSIGDGYRCPPA
jgi:putative transposase